MSINSFLKELLTGDNVRDYQHASRTFVDDNYALQPRYKYLFHVVFAFAPGVTQSSGFLLNNLERGSLHLMVKSVDLPQFSIDVQDKNQYNRRRYTQHKVDYQPVTITFHDDQSDIIRKLWYSYFRFYYQDSEYPSRNGSLSKEYTIDDLYTDRAGTSVPWGLDRGPLNANGKKFFSDIRIYSMFQKKYVEHVLVNPIITEFRHDRHDYAANEIMEHNMTIKYETVKYGEGFVNDDNPQNFALHHYDKTPSPLTPYGGGTNSVFRNGGLLDTANTAINDFANGNILGGIFNTARAVRNTKNMDVKRVVKDEVQQIGNDFLRGKNPLANTVFPQISGTSIQTPPFINPNTGQVPIPPTTSITSPQGNVASTSKFVNPIQSLSNVLVGRAKETINTSGVTASTPRKINS